MPDSIIGTNKFTVREYISGYRICKCQLSNGKSVTVVGNIPATKNLKLKYIGEWEVHSKYGKQFKAASYEPVETDTEEGVIAYLSSLKCGIGKVWAKRIYAKFGTDTWRILKDEPDRLLEIDKFGENRKNKLQEKNE